MPDVYDEKLRAKLTAADFVAKLPVRHEVVAAALAKFKAEKESLAKGAPNRAKKLIALNAMIAALAKTLSLTPRTGVAPTRPILGPASAPGDGYDEWRDR